ncbi:MULTISPECIES: fimbrial biogenesis outer membrane usher protein [unclassified Brevundimonas]|uniref:fimbrial biogenesis outer membrane usher protein n=1 Tax=unclassified Brevundimonas TaxID=2622653 RepID=UPI0025BA6432|nr:MULTISPECIES: fimbrial biogenesis outer membrane usher protein [unclassified Brevundimonas]
MKLWPIALATAAAGTLASPVSGSAQASLTQGDDVVRTAPRPNPERLNPSGRDIHLGGPLQDGQFILGEVDYVLTADDKLLADLSTLMPLLQSRLSESAFARVAVGTAGRQTVTAEALADLGIGLEYNPANFGLIVRLTAEDRPLQSISINGGMPTAAPVLTEPARFSASLSGYLTSSYVHQSAGSDRGFDTPSLILDGAARFGGVVLETEATVYEEVRRDGTRLIYDDLARTARYSLGDLEVASRGFAGAAPMLGIGVVRSYSQLDPQRNIQPRGQRTFTLERAATVETFINGRPVQSTRLEAGTYDIRDFPFAQGANDVRMVIRDDAGRETAINFSLNFDRSLLAQGLAEFGLFAGTETDMGPDGPNYSDRVAVSGFYRRGMTESLTAGTNFRYSDGDGVVGAEMIWASPIGSIGGDLALSSADRVGEGWALNLGYELAFGPEDRTRSLSATFQTVSENWASPGADHVSNPFAWEAGLTYSQPLTSTQYVAFDTFYSSGRHDNPDQMTFRGSYGWRLTPSLTWLMEGIYEDRADRQDYGARLTLNYRIGQSSSVRAEVDTFRDRQRIEYNTLRGQGVNSVSLNGSLDHTRDSYGVNAAANAVLNRAELGVNHQTLFASDGGRISDQRTILSAGSAIVFADGAFAVSRPVYDGFAILDPHHSLKGASVYVDPHRGHYTARSGWLGGAVTPEVSAYSLRTLTYDAPQAPTGYDIGTGTAQLIAPYRAGYRIGVGSDYSVSVVGALRNADGSPVALWIGEAVEIANPERAPARVFTNASGRFSLTGLRPGLWRIQTSNTTDAVYYIDVPADAEGLYRAGELKPEPRK